jgi:hypothetical protein
MSEAVDLEKYTVDIDREKGLEDTNSISENLADEEDKLSQDEIATSAVYDPASKVPTNAPRESGIIGISQFELS